MCLPGRIACVINSRVMLAEGKGEEEVSAGSFFAVTASQLL